jgi:hypothetical protein
VVYDEGLRSYKAIAFIESVTTVSYLELGATPKDPFCADKIPLDTSLKVQEKKNLWIK